MDDEVRLAVRRTGTTSDLPAVVLVHGGPGLWDYLGGVAALIDDATVVYRFDQRGCGASDPSDDQRFDRHVADLDKVRAALGLEAWAVVGHSFGATLALAYAARHPSRMSHLGYVSGVGIGDWHTAYQRERLRRMTDEQRAELADLDGRDRSPDEERRMRVLHWFTDHGDTAKAFAWATEDAQSPRPINTAANRALSHEMKAWTDTRFVSLAESVTAPCLVLHGGRDPRPASCALALAGHLRSSTTTVIEEAGHDPWRERPDVVRRSLLGLLGHSTPQT